MRGDQFATANALGLELFSKLGNVGLGTRGDARVRRVDRSDGQGGMRCQPLLERFGGVMRPEYTHDAFHYNERAAVLISGLQVASLEALSRA